MRRYGFLAVLLGVAVLMTACSSGPVRRVSEPAISIQQLTVQANGDWKVDLRLQNYSSIPMRFEQLSLAVQVSGVAAGQLQGNPQLSVGPESADIVSLPFKPQSQARIVLADALAGRQAISYSLEGNAHALPEEGKSREFEISTQNTLNPVPGLDGVLR